MIRPEVILIINLKRQYKTQYLKMTKTTLMSALLFLLLLAFTARAYEALLPPTEPKMKPSSSVVIGG